jgi:hypothetical protein
MAALPFVLLPGENAKENHREANRSNRNRKPGGDGISVVSTRHLGTVDDCQPDADFTFHDEPDGSAELHQSNAAT